MVSKRSVPLNLLCADGDKGNLRMIRGQLILFFSCYQRPDFETDAIRLFHRGAIALQRRSPNGIRLLLNISEQSILII